MENHLQAWVEFLLIFLVIAAFLFFYVRSIGTYGLAIEAKRVVEGRLLGLVVILFGIALLTGISGTLYDKWEQIGALYYVLQDGGDSSGCFQNPQSC